jgi:LmbE family N-acetylglucosaminyl deacetylase
VSIAIAGAGTPEAVWSPWLTGRAWPYLDLDAVNGRRILVLAAHPDDEILGVAGLLMTLSRRGHQIVMVWATDGEASHPGSSAFTPGELATIRRAESVLALHELGVNPTATHYLSLPDSQVGPHADLLRSALAAIAAPDDVVLAPWDGDGHPDHDALGAAALALPATTTWHYPIWMWHWSAPDDGRVAWDRVHRTPVPDLAAKARAIAHFRSQVEPIGTAGVDAAILPPHVLERFDRHDEWVFA